MTHGLIYGLHAGDGAVRYVGMTKRTMAARMAAHRNRARAGMASHLYNWIRVVDPSVVQWVVLEDDIPLEQMPDREIWWIAEMRSRGLDLVNTSAGGKGLSGVPCSEENRKRVGDRFRGVKPTPEQVARAAATRKASGYVPSAETRRKIAEANKGRAQPRGEAHWNHGRVHTPEHRDKLRATLAGRKFSPERLAHHLDTRPRGATVNTAKFTDAVVTLILARLADGERVGTLAAEYGVTRQAISRIKSGQTWSHIDRAAMNGGIAA